MNGLNRPKLRHYALVFAALGFATLPAAAQVPVDEDGNLIGQYEVQIGEGSEYGKPEGALMSATELEELVGPIALYPDDLLAIVLPASTYPLEIVQAARVLEQIEDDKSLEPDESWDDSVIALLNYPDVIQMMDEDIDWTWRLGEAVLDQQSDVIAAVESFRDRAYAAGNLKSDEYQEVAYDDDGILEIVPVNEEIIYVPYYEPAEVIVHQPVRRVYYYHPNPYPVYYYPYPAGYRFRSGYFWGVTTAFSIGWSNHFLHVYHPSYWGHPYYGRYYYGHYYRRPSITVYNNWYVNNSYRSPRYRYRDGDYWRPRYRAGSRQADARVRNYHYSPDRTRDSNRRSTTRRDQVRVTDNGRMDLNLRDRSNLDTDRSRTRSTASTRNTASVRRNANARTETSRRNDARSSTNRGNALSNRDSNRRSATSTSRQNQQIRNRATTDSAAANRNNRTANSRRNASNTDRSATTRRSSPARTSVNGATPPRVRQDNSSRRNSAINRSSTPAPQIRESSNTRRNATPPRASRPTPRTAAPAVQPRAPSAPRSDSRSGSRSQGAASGSRRSTSSRPRVRPNNRN